MGRSGEQSKFENRNSKIETPDSDATPGPNRMHLVARHADGTIFYDHTVRYLRPNAGGKQPFIRLARTTAGMSNNLPAKMQAGDTLQVVWTLSF